MTASLEKNLFRLKIEMIGLRRAEQTLTSASNQIESHLAWANFARHLRLCSKLLIRIGKSSGAEERAAAWRAENDIKKSGILGFLVASRNDIDHPEDDGKAQFVSGDMLPEHFHVNNGAISAAVYPGSIFSMSNCTFNGRPMNGYVSVDKDGLASSSGNIPYAKRRAGFYLNDVQDKDGNLISVPFDSRIGFRMSAIEIAELGRKWIDRNLLVVLPVEAHDKLQLEK